MPNRNILIVVGVVVGALIILLANSLYIVDQTTQALVLRLGEPVRMVNTPRRAAPGLYVKAPFLEEVVRFDKRNMALKTPQQEILTSDQGRMVVDAFVRYRISDPLSFFRAFRGNTNPTDALGNLTRSALREALGRATTTDIISGQRGALMQQIESDVARRTRLSRYGVEILDVRLRRADLPKENQEAVYRRMQSDRQREAQTLRAQGEAEATRIRAESQKLGDTIRGEGDAARAKVYAESFGRDPNFAAFYRSMQAYEAALANGETTLVLSPDSDFFKYFSRGPGR
jgi:modulator of FtsH protease HflC